MTRVKVPSPYPYNLKQTTVTKYGNGHSFNTSIYQFHGRVLKHGSTGKHHAHKVRYIVEVEQYDYNVYVVKFYCAQHKEYGNRYAVLTGYNDTFRILSTLIDIIMNILNKDPKATFAFKAEPCAGEEISNNKRYKVYAQLIANYVGVEKFEHSNIEDRSCYVLMNRNIAGEHPDLPSKVEKMFSSIYPSLFG